MKARYVLFTLLLAMPALPAYAANRPGQPQEVTCHVRVADVVPDMGGSLMMSCPSIPYENKFVTLDLRIQFGLKAGKKTDPGIEAFKALAAAAKDGRAILCFYLEDWKIGFNGFPFQCPGYTPTTLASR